jgi:biotin-(acetyl-CoA carboxylase) ligase
MPTDAQSRIHEKFGPNLDLPPPFRLHTLREAGRAFEHAQKIATKEGAGTLILVGRFDIVEFSLVLEPDEPLAAARRTIYAGMSALADALAVHAPPETLINFEWPDAIFVDGGLVGGGRLAWPQKSDENKRPEWLVFGAMIRTVIMGLPEPGLKPHLAALEDEGFDELGPGRLVETFCRHLMATIDAWQQDGFARVAESYLPRLPTGQGSEKMIDGVGDLLIRENNNAIIAKKKLLPALAKPSWLDSESGEMLS